ncbi:uncharacterized protein BDV17DRAFT_287444 [Aspergillus undulatus]|uniref:uncharacterized protein n=1 Tax=Aspergillus undulatus TaxID=1810928 RepID=UPI003CCE1D87
MYLFLTLSFTAYLLLTSILRTYQLNALRKKYAHLSANPYTMDLATAHGILLSILTVNFSFSYAISGQIALIKSYSIASGTKLLVATRRLSTTRGVGKRAEDTAIIFAEILTSGLDSERGLKTLSKLNWIHRQYGARITNEEMIHTMSLNVLGPLKWIDRFEWRPLLEVERVAVFLYWKEVAMRMGMVDVPETLDELGKWTAKYEKTEMAFAESNVKCLEATMDLYLRPLPRWMKGFGGQIVAALLEERVRAALGMEDPPKWVIGLVEGLLDARAWFVRVLMLPRFSPISVGGVMDETTGRIRRERWGFEPWYVAESGWSRFVSKWLGLNLWMGRPLPGAEYNSEGYLPEELGPKEYREKSKADVLDHAEKMADYARQGGGAVLGCPFAFGR